MEYREFISDEQRKELEKAYETIYKVYAVMRIEHEEYTVLGTALESLKRAIEYEKKFY